MLKTIILSLLLLSSCVSAFRVRLVVPKKNHAHGAIQFHSGTTTQLSVHVDQVKRSEPVPKCLGLHLRGISGFHFQYIVELHQVNNGYETTNVEIPEIQDNVSETILISITDCEWANRFTRLTAKVVDLDFDEAY